ncbi:MAG: hypothetical protein D5R97_02560 [Candidatus Syntrophonatronum acetioxidans]|uniref:Uncharacterized protein n=1 Tax=Candidatus Syntrophonatronum acetioxidans TaxID=1795816 RepID=A0A424YGZ7_9FIRM|nr:MAG: hypothetical protein D5R97_02560 [Candidatus Syntrophonatronum acetioxidans]
MAKKGRFSPVHQPDNLHTQKRCETCAKNTPADNACQVLTKRIGLEQDCWAWSDNPDWEKKVNEAVKAYKGGDF